MLALFIWERSNTVVNIGPMRAVMDGDNRGYSKAPGVDCFAARGCLTVDFDRKLISLRVNPTCGEYAFSFSCNDAFGINAGGWNLNSTYNYLRYWENAYDGKLDIKWDITQSMMPIIRPGLTVNGRLILWPRKVKTGFRFAADAFPSQEMYYINNGKRTSLLRRHYSDFNGMSRAAPVMSGTMYTNTLY